MFIMFRLSMPKNSVWNKKWTGDGKFYAVVKEFLGRNEVAKAIKILKKKHYYYDFKDGWEAKVAVTQIKNGLDVATINKASKGFCGYEWMIDSIINNQKIVLPGDANVT